MTIPHIIKFPAIKNRANVAWAFLVFIVFYFSLNTIYSKLDHNDASIFSESILTVASVFAGVVLGAATRLIKRNISNEFIRIYCVIFAIILMVSVILYYLRALPFDGLIWNISLYFPQLWIVLFMLPASIIYCSVIYRLRIK